MPDFDYAGSIEDTRLSKVGESTLEARFDTPISVGMLCNRLLSRFPEADAEPWDRTGLLVGDPLATVTRVAIALDPTIEAVRDAHLAGCNVLLTHHPVFLDPPAAFVRDVNVSYSGSVTFEAVSAGVALMNFHTALDVSAEARGALPAMLGLEPCAVLEPLGSSDRRSSGASAAMDGLPKGYGHICRIDGEDPLSLTTLSARCVSVFGRTPRVWGDMDASVASVCTWTGSAGSAARRCISAGVDALICGEIKYHDAVEARDSGLCVIELGHDVSELPLTAILARAVLGCGIDQGDVCMLNQHGNWQTPESRRV